MSDEVIGLIVVLCGLGMLWTAREAVGVRMDVNRWKRREWAKAGARRGRLARYLFPVAPTAELVVAYAIGVAAIVGGVVAFWL